MKRSFIGACLLIAGTAMADGVPLITPAAPLGAGDPVRAHWPSEYHPTLVKLHAVNLNRQAFGAPIVSVVIDGTTHTYRGGLVPPPAGATFQHWTGQEDDKQGRMTLTKIGNEISGSIFVPPNRAFTLTTRDGRTILAEGDAARVIPPRDGAKK